MKRLQRAKLANIDNKAIIDEALQTNINIVLKKWHESKDGVTLSCTIYRNQSDNTPFMVVESSLSEVQP